ncbi:hypothetical protein LJC57_01300 [Parabacteroides sp. OttesenSCG-928-G07]|nr:hypothetical protein [Parabacteroides sp. OttesenSCG-928-G07]
MGTKKENIQNLFITEYELNEQKFTGEIWAKTWEEAEDFVKQRSATEKVIGITDKTFRD